MTLQSRYTFTNVSSVLYETVTLESAEQCGLTLGMLMKRKDIARHMRHLIVKPQGKHKSGYNTADSAASSASVRAIAGAMCLDALRGFQWFGDELPYHEDMWFALRLGCVRDEILL